MGDVTLFRGQGAPDPASLLTGLSSEFAEQVDRKPTLGELLEILNEAVKGMFAVRVTFSAKPGPSGTGTVAGNSFVGDVGDSVFEDARYLLEMLAASIAGPERQEPSPAQLASALSRVLKESPGVLHDVRGGERVTVKASKGPVKPVAGDVLAIPAREGGYHLAVVVARNQIGTALGIFRGKFAEPVYRREDMLPGRRIPVYTDDELLREGKWRIVGHDDALRAQFPSDPEIYHAPGLNIPGIDYGEYGLAETAAGNTRFVGPDEAGEVGLLDHSYRQVQMSEDLQELLDSLWP